MQDKNAGNSGDLVKHIVYLALLRELARASTGAKPHVIEAHGGKGVYVSAHPHLLKARRLEHFAPSTLGRAQAACFQRAPAGFGQVTGLANGEIAYAGPLPFTAAR